MKAIIETPEAPAAIGPYSQAASLGNLVFCSGQIGIDPESGVLADGIEAQTRRVLANLRAVLSSAGMGFEDVIRTTLFVTDLRQFELINRIYGEYFTVPYPARSTVQVAALPRGALLEIDVIAGKSDK